MEKHFDIECPYCEEVNTINIEAYTGDLYNLRDLCSNCGNPFVFDIVIRYDIEAYQESPSED